MFSFIIQHKIPNQTIILFAMYYDILLNLYHSGFWPEAEGTVKLVVEESLLFTKVWRGFRETSKG